MGIESIVDVQVSVASIRPSREGFGVPMLMGYHTVDVGGPLVRTYTSLDGLVSDGHLRESTIYTMASRLYQQTPHPPSFKVGRRLTAWHHIATLTCSVATTGYVYKFNVALGLFATVALSYTVPSSSTTTTVATAVAALINALSASGPFGSHAFTATATGAVITFTATDNGLLYTFANLPASIAYKDVSTAASVSADLAAVLAEDPAWYLLAIDQETDLAVEAVAAAIETTRKMFVATNADKDNTDHTSTTCLGYVLKSDTYMRTLTAWHPDSGTHLALAWASSRLTVQPGSDTWSLKSLAGVRAYTITDTASSALLGFNVNIYTVIADEGVTQNGTMASGEWADIVRGVDWLVARIKERVYAALRKAQKIPFTDEGIAVIVQEIDAQLEIASGDDVKLVVKGSYAIEAPKASDVPDADRARRTLPNVRFSADLQGAIHAVTIFGTVSE